MKLDSFMDTTIRVAAVYGVIYLAMLIFGLPRQIREQAKVTPTFIFPNSQPPFDWDQGRTKTKLPPLPVPTVQSVILEVRTQCNFAPGTQSPNFV